MGNGMNKVLPGLYIGNVSDAKNEQQLAENKITHIVSAHENAKPLLKEYKYHCIKVADVVGQDLMKGGNVLVHCIGGISRSTTLTTAYIMTVTDMDWREILKCIKCCRSVANPNRGFQSQLHQYSTSADRKTLKDQLEKKFPTNPHNDEEFLENVISEASARQVKMSEEFKDGVETVAKYASASNRNIKVFEAEKPADDVAE